MVKEFKQGQEHVLMMLQTLASHSLSKKVALLPQPAGVHGQVALQHVVRVFEKEQERALTILQVPSMSQKLVKKVALLPHPAGVHGQVALQHAVMVAKQELEHVLITLQAPLISQKLTKKVATFTNAVMTIGQYGVHGIHAPNVGPFHSNDNALDENSSKYQLVRKRVNRFDTNIKR